MSKPLALIAVLACMAALAWSWLAPAPQAPHVVFQTLSGRQLAMDDLHRLPRPDAGDHRNLQSIS